MAEPTIPEINRNIAWMRGNLQSTPKGMHPEIAQMVRDVRNMYFAPADRPVGATPAMQSAAQGQPLGIAQEPVRPVPGMSTLGSEMGARVPPGYSGPRPAPQVGEMMGRMQDPRMSLSDMIRGMGAQPQMTSPAEETNNLRRVAGIGAGIGAIASGSLGGAISRLPAAAPAVMAGGVLEAAADPQSRLRQAARQARENVSEAYRTEGLPAAVARQVGAIPKVAYETLGAAGAPFEKMAGATLRNLAIGAGLRETPTQEMARARDIYERELAPGRSRTAAAPATTTIPAEALSARPMAGAPAMATSAAADGPQTVRIHRMGSGGGLTTTYDVSPGAPIGKVLSVEGMPPGLTPQEYLYNLQALKSANIAANQQRAAAGSIIGSLRQGMPMDKESGQFLAGLAQAAGKGVEPIRPQLPTMKQEKPQTVMELMRQDAYRLSEDVPRLEAAAELAKQQNAPDAAQLAALAKARRQRYTELLRAMAPSAGVRAQSEEELYGGQ